MTRRSERLALVLEELARRTPVPERIQRDPVVFPGRFQDPRDVEIAGWLASALAYGRASLFQAAMEQILSIMDGKPCVYVMGFDPRKDLRRFSSVYYRMNSGRDIACLIYFMQQILRRHRSVGALFCSLYRDKDPDIGPTLERFVRRVQGIDTTPIYGKNECPRGLAQFFPLPSGGSACKRLNLYLRWMIRPNDGLDFGIWKDVPPGKLIIPLDTHVHRISRYLGLTKRKTAGWSTAKEITAALQRIDPADPLRFDFPLCHHGMSGNCPIEKVPEKCRVCALLTECVKGRAIARRSPRNNMGL